MNEIVQLFLRFVGEAAANVEYSIDPRPSMHSVTLPIGWRARTQIREAAALLRFGGEWERVVDRMIERILPNAILLRFDVERDVIAGLTAYLRFAEEPDERWLDELVRTTSHFRVSPGLPAAAASLFDCRSPRGLSIRGDRDGHTRLALYFSVKRDITMFSPATVKVLLETLGWPLAGAPAIEADLRAVHPGGSVGVIGIDLGANGDVDALKFDPANVPPSRWVTFLEAKRASHERMEHLGEMSRILHAKSLSYLGLKYVPEGFAGWRAYFSFRPSGRALALQPAIFVDSPGDATLRLPHY